jgi:hypothetical protein
LSKYRPPPTLARFMLDDAPVRCAVGPIGSGKSTACIMELLRRAAGGDPDSDGKVRSRFAVIRNSYRELRDTTRKTFEQWIGPAFGRWSEQDFSFHLRSGNIESEIMFRSLDRPEDKKKLLSLELTGAYVNEARTLAKDNFDTLTGRVGRYPSKPKWSGIWMDSNPWHSGHWLSELFRDEPSFKLFRQPGGLSPDAENVENLRPNYYADLLAGKDQQWINVYVHGQDAVGDAGSVYGELLDHLERRGGMAPWIHDENRTYCAWDLGHADAEAIWWYQINAKGAVDVIDWYENSGKPHSHYWAEVEARPWKVERHHLPHDAKQKTAQTGLSTIQQFLKRWPNVTIVPSISVEDGIAAARWLLEQPTRFHPRCGNGIKRLREYRYEFDEQTRNFSSKPLHNHASNSADAFRYLAVMFKGTSSAEGRHGAQIQAAAASKSITFRGYTIDDLFRDSGPVVIPLRKRI